MTRQQRPAAVGSWSTALSLAAFLVAAAVIVFLLFTRQLLGRDPVAITVQVLALALMVWARKTFGVRSFHAGANPTAGGLITHGPYRYWRHPIYASIIYFVLAGAFSHRTVQAAVGAVVVTGALWTRMLLEERLLRRTYPEYGDYAARAKRLVPFLL